MKKIGKHPFDSIFIEVDQVQKDKALISLNTKLNDLIKFETELYQTCSDIMKNLNIACRKASRKILDEIVHVKSMIKILIENGDIEREESEKKFSFKRAAYFEQFGKLKSEINLLLNEKITNICFKNQNEIYKEDEELFFIIPNSLVKINLETFKKSQHAVQYSSTYQSSCRLQDGTFFVHQIDTANCFILNLGRNTLSPLPNCPVAMSWGFAGCIDDSVYLIRTNNPPVNEKINIKTRQWTKIASSPLNTNTLGGIINKKVCIAYSGFTTAYIYEPSTNIYNSIPNVSGDFRVISHGFILATQNIYKVKNDDEYTWTSIPYNSKSQDSCFCLQNQYIFKRGKYLYFCKCGQNPLFRFDTELYRLDTVAYS